MGDILLLLNTVAAKTDNQKLPTINRWNMIRYHGWDAQKQKRKLVQCFHQIVTSFPGELFWPLNPNMRPGGNSGFVIADYYDDNVEKYIVFGG